MIVAFNMVAAGLGLVVTMGTIFAVMFRFVRKLMQVINQLESITVLSSKLDELTNVLGKIVDAIPAQQNITAP